MSKYKELRLGTLNYLACRNFHIDMRVVHTGTRIEVIVSKPHAGIVNARKCLAKFDEDFPKKCCYCQTVKDYIVKDVVEDQSYRCNFCGRPLLAFKGGKYEVAEIHHFDALLSKKIQRASTWKWYVKKEIITGIEELDISCPEKGCHRLLSLKGSAKIFCPDCAKQRFSIGLQRIRDGSKRDYKCPKCGGKWFNPDRKSLIPLERKRGYRTCPSCGAELAFQRRRRYECPECGKEYRISQSKKNKGKLVEI